VDAPTPTKDDIGTGKEKINTNKNPIRQKVERKFVNCGSKANPSGAGEQLRFNPANPHGAGQAEPNPRGGSGLLGHSDSASSSYFSVAALKKRGRAERETFFFVFLNILLGDFFSFCSLQNSALLHMPHLRFHCADGCWDRTQDRYNWCIGSQTL
jgi:hypothetical protein